MCASGAQNTIQQEDIATMQQYDQQQAKQYANQTALYAQVKSVLDPILNAGPNQQGFSAAELNTLNAQAVEGTAENYSAAGKAVGEATAAEGGGDNPLPSGAQTQLKQEVANSAAEQESSEETQIQGADYQQGQQNFTNAEQGEMAIAAGENPLGQMQRTRREAKRTRLPGKIPVGSMQVSERRALSARDGLRADSKHRDRVEIR